MDTYKTSVSLKGVKGKKCSIELGKAKRSARYNNKTMLEQTIWAKNGFAKRLTELRTKRGVSARDMSLSMGMASNYINGIENGDTMPSMSMFFEICEYLQITPMEFFRYTEFKAGQARALISIIDTLDDESINLLLAISKRIKG